MKKVYLDNGSTSFPKAPGVGEAMADFLINSGYNISRGGYEGAYGVAERVLETRSLLKEMFNFYDEKHVVFTPGATYSLNFVIKGLVKKGERLLISSMEHNGVARPACAREKEGAELAIVQCDGEGFLHIDELKKALEKKTALAVISHASNVSGSVQELEEIGAVCRERGVPLVVDAAQSAGVIDIDFQKCGLSALCLAGHKGLLGPQGTGALLIAPELAERITPVIDGGTGSASHLLEMPPFMPDRLEAGTLNLPGIMGLSAALKYLREVGAAAVREHERKLAGIFMDGLKETAEVRIAGTTDLQRRNGTVSLDFRDVDNAEAAYELEEKYGIMTRCGLHCAPLAHKTLGTYPQGTVRFAFGLFSTEEEAEYAAEAVNAVCRAHR